MAARALRFVPAFYLLLSFSSTAFSQDFPKMEDLEKVFYQTEVQITDVIGDTAAYATEYYDGINKMGALKVYFQGDRKLIYFDEDQITDINGPNCIATAVKKSGYDYNPMYLGWLNQNPIVIGPSAPFFYAQTRRNEIKYANTETIRSIKCDKFTLDVVNTLDNLTYEYYFAVSTWTTPYKDKKLRAPIRIRIVGKSSRGQENPALTLAVDQINDFAYYNPNIDDVNNLLPPTGIGCAGRKLTEVMPTVPKVFQYAAEVVDLLASTEHADIEIQYHRIWYDYTQLLARRDINSRRKGYTSNLFDFNTGTRYKITDGGSCETAILRDSDFQKYDKGTVTSVMKNATEILNLDGKFYEMGERDIRGLECDTFESVEFDKHFQGILYHKLVVTVYFTEFHTNVAINGESESQIPIYYIITGYETPEKKTLQLQYNIFAFDDVVWPSMFSSFRLERCYTKPDQKVSFVLVLPVPLTEDIKMKDQDELAIARLRKSISIHAKVPEMRIPYLKADYTSTGVFVSGVMIERPPALLQFYEMDTDTIITKDPHLKVIPEAENTEQCSYACVDEKKFTCKGFYFCGEACFLKSIDPFVEVDKPKPENLGVCTEYLRSEVNSSNSRQAYLVDALANLEKSVIAETLSVIIDIPNGTETLTVKDIIIGDGPYTGTDSTDKPFTVSVELRKLDSSLETVTVLDYAGSLHDCYKRCKDAGSQCSSFSYCPDKKGDEKECMASSDLVIKGTTKDTEIVSDQNCNIYNLNFLDYFEPYPEKVSFLDGDKIIEGVQAVEKCAQSCRLEKDFTCRGFEYCKSKKFCTLHKKHILDLKPSETVSAVGKTCTHYAARYFVDYVNMGGTLIDDENNVRFDTSLEECAKICSEDLKMDCKSFNYCPKDVSDEDNSCALSTKLLTDGSSTTVKKGCMHYEKRDSVHDWDINEKKIKQLSSGYSKKAFTGLVVGMIALGVIIGALAFVFYGYMKSRSSGDGMAVRFMKNES